MTRSDQVLRALSHPTRLRMLSLLWGQEASTAELARRLDVGHGLASQHLRRLREADLVREVRHETVRGGKARVYTAVPGTHLSDLASGDHDIEPLIAVMASLMTSRRALKVSGEAAFLAEADLCVPGPVWERVRANLAATAQDLHDHACAPTDRSAVRVGLTVAAIPMRDS